MCSAISSWVDPAILLRQERQTFADVQKDDLYFLRDKLIQRQDLMLFRNLSKRIERLSQKIDELDRDQP